ncbi:MAG: Fe-S cluster assembly protein SufD [Actinomycetota bacterium]
MVSLSRPIIDELDASRPLPGRAEAFAAYEQLPVPSAADESWRYVEHDLDPDKVALALTAGSRLADDPLLAALESSAGAVLVDGQIGETYGPWITEGVDLLDLVPVSADKFAAAHRAFVTGGVIVDVPAGRHTDAPLLIELQTTSPGTISFPHVTIRIGDDAEAEVVIAHRSADGLEAVTVPQIEADLGAGGRLRLMTVQELSTDTSGIVQLRARLGRDATFRLGEIGLGARLGRLDLGVELDGRGSSAQVVGLFFGHRDQVLDYRMVLNHRGPKSTSKVLLKGAVEDSAHSIFSGLVRIEKPAIGANAFETNRNLVLSPDAKANSVPNLEILCDDVICGHGSSVGPLEEEHLYYLQSRGLSLPRAERLLIRGFFREVIDRLPVAGMERPLADILERRFVRSRGEE